MKLDTPKNSTYWTVVNDGDYELHGLPGGLVLTKSSQGLSVPIFTDEDLANRFIEESGVPNRTAISISDKVPVDKLLTDCLQLGVTHVAIDCPASPNSRRESGAIAPIAIMLKILGTNGQIG